MVTNSAEVLIEIITKNYPTEPVQCSSIPSHDPDGARLVALLDSDRWDVVLCSIIPKQKLVSVFYSLNTASRVYYLPVLLIEAIRLAAQDNQDGAEVLHSLLFILYPPEWGIESLAATDALMRLMTLAQKNAVAEVLRFLASMPLTQTPNPTATRLVDLALFNCWGAFEVTGDR